MFRTHLFVYWATDLLSHNQGQGQGQDPFTLYTNCQVQNFSFGTVETWIRYVCSSDSNIQHL